MAVTCQVIQTHNNRSSSIGRERQHERRQPIQVPICLHWRAVSPCYTAIPLESLWHIRRWALINRQYLVIRTRMGKRKLTFNNSINRTTLLAVTAVDTLGHINIISGCSSTTVFTFFGLDGDGLSWANGFAEFAGDAALFARGVATEGVFTAESGEMGPFRRGRRSCNLPMLAMLAHA